MTETMTMVPADVKPFARSLKGPPVVCGGFGGAPFLSLSLSLSLSLPPSHFLSQTIALKAFGLRSSVFLPWVTLSKSGQNTASDAKAFFQAAVCSVVTHSKLQSAIHHRIITFTISIALFFSFSSFFRLRGRVGTLFGWQPLSQEGFHHRCLRCKRHYLHSKVSGF